MSLGVGAFALKMVSLAEQWDAYLDGRQPNADAVGTLNRGSTALSVGAMGVGYTQGLSSTAVEDVNNLVGTLLNDDVKAAARKLHEVIAGGKADNCAAYAGVWEWGNGGVMTFDAGHTWLWKRGAGVAIETEHNTGRWECRDDAAGVIFYEADHGEYPGCLIMSKGTIYATDCTAHGAQYLVGTRRAQ